LDRCRFEASQVEEPGSDARVQRIEEASVGRDVGEVRQDK
jgi:hypothetical protein